MCEVLSGSSYFTVLNKDSLFRELLQQTGAPSLWGSRCCKPPKLSRPVSQHLLVGNEAGAPFYPVAQLAALLNYLGYRGGRSLHALSLAPDLRAPKLNPPPLPIGSLWDPWLVRSKGFTMASCCICFNTTGCFSLTWTLVSHRDKQMAFR